jgi:hypothetical protein
MENHTSFDLSVAIRRWRENLAQSPTFRSEDLEELESHLEDSVRELAGRGLSAEEAFTIATRRIGTGPGLAAEFAGINGHALWIDRLFWMLFGATSAFGFWSLVQSIGVVVRIPNDLNLPVLFLVLVWVTPVIVGVILVRSLVRGHGTAPRLLANLLRRPLRLSVAVLLLGLSSVVLRVLALCYITGHNLAREILVTSIVSLIGWIIAATFIRLLAVRRLRPDLAR